MKLKNVMLLVVSGTLAVLLSGCGAKDCPKDFEDQATKAMGQYEAEAKDKSLEESKKICLEKFAVLKQYDGCKLPEKNKQGNEYKDFKGKKITHFDFKEAETICAQ